ncbi:MAG: hypothetical protein WCT42_03805 [Candidatus Paceibacterota bacterium]
MKDKKLVTVLLILVIILLVGGAYMLGKGNNKESEKELNIEENNGQQVSNNSSDCLPTTAPWIKVLSPNGGETYLMGQKTTIKWNSCNLPNSTHLRAYLERQAPLPDYEWQNPILFGNVSEGQVSSSLNDGEQLVILDSIHDVVPASYRLCIAEYVTPPGQNIIQGCSNGILVINSSSKESSTEVSNNQYTSSGCKIVSGCNGPIICIDENTEIGGSTCVALPEYACYKASSSRCEKQTSGKCDWTNTLELKSCIEKARNQ